MATVAVSRLGVLDTGLRLLLVDVIRKVGESLLRRLAGGSRQQIGR